MYKKLFKNSFFEKDSGSRLVPSLLIRIGFYFTLIRDASLINVIQVQNSDANYLTG